MELELLRQAYEQFKRIELYLRLMNLARRHALPVVSREDPSGSTTTDGEIANSPNLTTLNSKSAKRLQEFADPQVMAVQQMRLATLMHYDRFAALQDEVEKFQLDNRRLVESVIRNYLK